MCATNTISPEAHVTNVHAVMRVMEEVMNRLEAIKARYQKMADTSGSCTYHVEAVKDIPYLLERLAAAEEVIRYTAAPKRQWKPGYVYPSDIATEYVKKWGSDGQDTK